MRRSMSVRGDSPSAPGLWILVDAETGKVVKKWRG